MTFTDNHSTYPTYTMANGAALATGGMGFLQVLWDPNRQAVQDKLADTVVVDLRGPRAPVAVPVAPEILPP